MDEEAVDVERNRGSRGSRKYVFTLNNYSPEHVAELSHLVETKPSVQYIIWGYEVGESNTPHLQGFVYFKNVVKFPFVKKCLVGNPHIEVAKTLGEAIDYCKKDGNFVEFGVKPLTKAEQGQLEIAAYDDARAAAVSGNFDIIRSDIFIRHYSSLKRIYADQVKRPAQLEKLDNWWIYGPSGIGKSRYVRHHWPDLYDKLLNKWWEGYAGEETILLDDVGPWSAQNGGLSDMLKRWADRYPFRAENKGSAIFVRPSRIVVTSQYRIQDLWTDPETVAALSRRFQVLHLSLSWCPPRVTPSVSTVEPITSLPASQTEV